MKRLISAKALAIAAAVGVVAIFIAANAHLVLVATASQPACVKAAPDTVTHRPAKRSC